MVKLLAYLSMTSASVGLSIAVMIFGWGLHPQSWWWIIGGGVVGTTVVRMVFDRVEKELKKQ